MDFLLLGTWGATALAAIAASVWRPIVREQWVRRIALHAGVVATIVLVSGVGGLATRPPRLPPPWMREGGPALPPPPRGMGRLLGPPPLARAGLAVVLYALVASVSHAVLASRQARARERRALLAEARLAQAQLAALQMQLNPHFLFNALNGIAALMHSDLHAADRMLGDLSELLRMALEAADAPEIPLRRELAFLDRYLAIEQTRYGDRLTVTRRVDPTVLDAVVPTLVLQPLVENAIKHGVEPNRAPGTITIDASRDGDTLHMGIADSGARATGAVQSANGHGIGLSNTRARLAQLYPGAHALTVEPGDPTGTRVRLAIPYRTLAGPAATVSSS